MSFIDIARRRSSIRSFKEMPIEKEKLLQVLEAGRLSPSAVNYQPRHFIVLTDENIKKQIAESYPRDWFKKTPVIIAICGDHSQSWKRKDGKDHCDIDAAIAVDHMTLCATDIGLGTCWVCAFDAEKCHKVLSLPDNMEVIALLAVGYPVEENGHVVKNRKDISGIISWERYNG